MQTSEFLSTVFSVFDASRERKHLYQHADDTKLDGKHISLEGETYLSFGSCSYLGLEVDPRMREGVLRAVEKYGTQFSCSRSYLSAPPYRELEERFSELFGAPAMLTASTTLGHLSAIPVLVNEKDAIIMDHQVHASVQTACTLAKAGGAVVEVVRHGDRAGLEEAIERLTRTRRHVWYMCDGVFSMFGDLPDVPHLRELMNRYEQMHMYVDDAHGMSIAGLHGRGVHLHRMGHHPRMVVAVSFAKAFAAGGACIVFPDSATRDRVRLCGGTMIFSGPMQPPMLGALRAGVDIHLSKDITKLQDELAERVSAFNRMLLARDLPLLAENEAPIFFIKTGPLRVAWDLASRIRSEGIYVNITPYPGVPMKRAGVRIAVTRHHSLEDLERLADAIARQLPNTLQAESITREEIEAHFSNLAKPATGESRTNARLTALFGEHISLPNQKAANQTRSLPANAEMVHARSISELNQEEWDSLLGHRGLFSSKALQLLETVFSKKDEPENNWDFHYFIVRYGGRPVVATFFTEALWKDDMLMRSEVSQLVEEKRKTDPYFLTSRMIAMGSLLTEGNHLFVERTADWRPALAWVLEEAENVMRKSGSTALVVRDLPDGDAEIDRFMLDEGLVKVPMLASYELRVDDWTETTQWIERLGKQTKKLVRKEMIEASSMFDLKVYGEGTEQPPTRDLLKFHELYRNLKTRKLRLNTHDLPNDLLARACTQPGWEILSLSLKTEFGGPVDGSAVAMGVGFAGKERYVAVFCGLDYGYRHVHVYRQLLWQFIQRARLNGCKYLGLGMDADFEKSRLGSVRQANCVYIQAIDHFNGVVLDKLVQEVSLQATKSVA